MRDGDDYVINGRKWFASAADGASFAIVMAVTDPDADPYRRASLIVVPTDTPGFRRVRNISCMGHAGDDWASHAELVFDDCRVPRENLLGEEGAGFAMAQARLGPGRIQHTMRWIGVCRRALEMMCDRAATRQLAPGDSLGSRQTVQNWIAESRAAIDAARLLVLHAAWTIDTQGIAAAREAISLIKFHVAGVMQEVVDRAIQTHGALGISDDTVLSWFYRQERAARIYDGPDEVHKAVVAKRILKQHGIRPDSRNPPIHEVGDERPDRRDPSRARRRTARRRTAARLPGGPPAGRRGTARGRAVPSRALEPDVPDPRGRPGMGLAPASLRQSGQDGPRHGPRVPHPLAALPVYPPAPAPVALLRG